MSHTNGSKSIKEFLSMMAGGKEAGLMIAKNEAELSNFAKAIERSDFKRLVSVLKYQNADYSWYVVINDRGEYKKIYDFICQYPLTIVSLFDSVDSKTVSFKPDYKNAVIFIATEEILRDFQKAGFDLLGRVGPVYRSE